MAKRLWIVGAGGHGRVLAAAATEGGGYSAVTFLGQGPEGPTEVDGWPCLYGSEDGPEPCADVIVGVGDNRRREAIQAKYQQLGYNIASVIHVRAIVGRRCLVGPGAAVMAGAVVQTGAVIGPGAIVNTRASVDHDCTVADFAHIAPGAVLAGHVAVGARTLVGVGAAVRNGVRIAADIVVGVGAAVVADLGSPGTYIGVPARRAE